MEGKAARSRKVGETKSTEAALRHWHIGYRITQLVAREYKEEDEGKGQPPAPGLPARDSVPAVETAVALPAEGQAPPLFLLLLTPQAPPLFLLLLSPHTSVLVSGDGSSLPALPQSFWVHQFGDPVLFYVLKLTGWYHIPSLSTRVNLRRPARARNEGSTGPKGGCKRWCWMLTRGGRFSMPTKS